MKYTPLDSLKEAAARGHLTLSNAINVLQMPDALGLPDAVDTLVNELATLHNILLEGVTAHVDDVNSLEANSFSDGRPVRTMLPLEEEITHHQIWSADPDSPRDQPGVVCEFITPSATHWRIVILRQGEVDGVRVED